MAEQFALFKDDRLVGIYLTRNKADQVAAKLITSLATKVRVDPVEVDYPVTQLAAGELLWLVRWDDITDTGTMSSQQIEFGPDRGENDYTYDSRRRVYRVAVWNATRAGAEAEADAFRQAYITANGIT